MAKAYSYDLRQKVLANYFTATPKIDIIRIFQLEMDTLHRWIKLFLPTGDVKPKNIARENLLMKSSIIIFKIILPQQLISQPVIFLDESGIRDNLRKEHGWSKKGIAIRGEKTGKVRKKIDIISGLLNKRLIAPMTYECNINAQIFNQWLKECLIPVLPRNCIIVMNNAPFHKSAETRIIIEGQGHRLLYLPAYSPDFNPIENYWGTLKTKLRKVMPKYENLFDAIKELFKDFGE